MTSTEEILGRLRDHIELVRVVRHSKSESAMRAYRHMDRRLSEWGTLLVQISSRDFCDKNSSLQEELDTIRRLVLEVLKTGDK